MLESLVIDWTYFFLITCAIFGMAGSLLNCHNVIFYKRVAFKLWLTGDVLAIVWAHLCGNWWLFLMYSVMTVCCIYGLKEHPEVDK